MENDLQVVEPRQIQVTNGGSPMAMMAELMSGGVDIDVDKMAKLLEVQKDWEANEAKKAYHVAMAAFKENPPVIIKDKNVSYSNTRYKHASLANVASTINSALGKHGLAAAWTTGQKDGMVHVVCRITHILGHSESTELFAAPDATGSKNAIQSIGSTVTYLQRYTILALTGLATDEHENDGRPPAEPPKARPATESELGIIQDICAELPEKDGFTPNISRITAICLETSRDYLVPEYVVKMAEHLVQHNGDESLYCQIAETEAAFEPKQDS